MDNLNKVDVIEKFLIGKIKKNCSTQILFTKQS